MTEVLQVGRNNLVDCFSNCPECDSPRLIRDHKHQELICQDCGLVLEDTFIDEGPEWVTDVENKNNRVRVGAPSTFAFHDKGLSTKPISIQDCQKTSISPKVKEVLFKIMGKDRRYKIDTAKERNLAFALNELLRMISALSLPPQIREDASLNYRKIMEMGLVRGRILEGVVAAVLYATIRQFGIPRTLDEVASCSRVNKKDIGQTYRSIVRKIGFEFIPVNPTIYVPKICSSLDLKAGIQVKAVEILRRAEEKNLTVGRNPVGVAGAAVYIAAKIEGEKRTQEKISEVAGVSEVTLRNRYKELVEKLEIIFRGIRHER